jgi:hypothetical protein
VIFVNISDVWLEAARVEGRRRDAAHKGHGSYLADEARKEDHNITGLIGEVGFSLGFGVPVDWSDRPTGDDGTDFVIGRCTIDVKTARIPKYLFLPVEARNRSNLYVLAGWYPLQMEVHLLGWTLLAGLLAAPTAVTKYGVENHQIVAAELRDVEDLLARIKRYRRNILNGAGEPLPIGAG